MSSFAGTISTATERQDKAFQLAPADGDGPDLGTLLNAFQTTMASNQPHVDQCRLNYETRYAIWPGQSADGKKHAREGNGKIDPTPWDGASDIRVYMVDDAINRKIARNGRALTKATMVAIPTNGYDVERAEVVANFMRWLINCRIPNLAREQELLSNYVLEKGLALTGQFWQITQEKTLATLKIADLQRAFPRINIPLVFKHPELEDQILAVLEEHFGVSAKKARSMLKELRKTGETTAPVLGPEISRPIIRAFCLDRDIFIPSWATDLETCPYIFRVEYFTAEQLRALGNTENWDADWIEQAILKCRGQIVTSIPDSTLQPISRSFVYIDRKEFYTDLIGVVFAYQRLSDEDGVPGIYLTIFNPNLPADSTQDGYAKFGLLGYQHGQYPFVLHRREFLSRKFHDSRGIAEPGKSWQDQVKAHMDSRIDAASIGVLPPLCYPLGRAPTRWGPGARVPEKRPGEIHYADRPQQDLNTDNSQAALKVSFNEYNGQPNPQADNGPAQTMDQWEVYKYLLGWSEAYKQVWKLWQQYGDDRETFRVMGLQKAPPQVIQKGSPFEDFDFRLTFDTLMLSPEAMDKKIEAIVTFCQSVDKNGQTDWSQLLQIGLEWIDSSIAERVIQPKQTGQQQVVQQVQGDLAQIYAGVPHDLQIGTPPDLAIQVMQQWAQQPDIQQRYQSDPAFKKRLDTYAQQAMFQKQQQQNKVIGKIGTASAGTPQAPVAGQPVPA